jgi:hypothetical protein
LAAGLKWVSSSKSRGNGGDHQGQYTLACADDELLVNFAANIGHVAVYKALRGKNTYDLDPIDAGEFLPENSFRRPRIV